MSGPVQAYHHTGPLGQECESNPAASFWRAITTEWTEHPESFWSNKDKWFTSDMLFNRCDGVVAKTSQQAQDIMLSYFSLFGGAYHQCESFVALPVPGTEDWELWENSTEFYDLKSEGAESTSTATAADAGPASYATYANVEDRTGKAWELAQPTFMKFLLRKGEDGRLRMAGEDAVYNEGPLKAAAARKGLLYPTDPLAA